MLSGIFLFRFWEFGSWTEIYIDDQLPTVRRGGCVDFNINKCTYLHVCATEKKQTQKNKQTQKTNKQTNKQKKNTQRGGRLIFASNKQEPNEFWVPLFEKAYAKLLFYVFV